MGKYEIINVLKRGKELSILDISNKLNVSKYTISKRMKEMLDSKLYNKHIKFRKVTKETSIPEKLHKNRNKTGITTERLFRYVS